MFIGVSDQAQGDVALEKSTARTQYDIIPQNADQPNNQYLQFDQASPQPSSDYIDINQVNIDDFDTHVDDNPDEINKAL